MDTDWIDNVLATNGILFRKPTQIERTQRWQKLRKTSSKPNPPPPPSCQSLIIKPEYPCAGMVAGW